jgi:hypothetical protein
MTRTIKITNQRRTGSLYHFAHFMTDCLLPEILAGVHDYDRVLRQRTIPQTIGNFHAIYTEVMGVEHRELLPEEFNAHEGDDLVIDTRGHENTLSSQDFERFRTHIFSLPGFGPDRLLPGGERPWRFAFWRRKRPAAEPDILLIKRYGRIELLSDPALKDAKYNITTGKERREIAEIDRVEQHLREIYGDRVRAVHLEFVPFADQVLYFAKARLIVAAHGAALSNMLFCKPGTRIIEVTCGARWPFFDTISGLLGLEHVKCRANTFAAVARCIAENPV